MDGIGNTPLFHIRGNNEILLKLEGSNLFGSIKDRAAAYIVERGRCNGNITSSTEIIESSSGNFAIALAGVCKIYHVKFTCVIDPLISNLNRRILELLDANIVMIAESDITGNYAQERIKRVKMICENSQNVYWPNQYDNFAICDAYRNTIGMEIASIDNIDYVFVAVSTCGTIAGISQALKNKQCNAKVIAVDIEGSKIFRNDNKVKRINGMGASFIPPNLKNAYIDEVIIISTEECINGCFELLSYGIFAGGSSGAVLAACKKFISNNSLKGKKIVCVLPDRGERYIDSIYNDTWIKELGYEKDARLIT